MLTTDFDFPWLPLHLKWLDEFFSEKNLCIFRLLTAYIWGSTCTTFFPSCPKGFLLPYWVCKDCRCGKVWEQWKACFSNPEFALYEYSELFQKMLFWQAFFSCNFIHKIFDRNLNRGMWNNFVLRLLKFTIAAGCMLVPFPQLSYHVHLCRNSNCRSNSHKRCSPQRITLSKEKYLGQWFSLSGLKCSS